MDRKPNGRIFQIRFWLKFDCTGQHGLLRCADDPVGNFGRIRPSNSAWLPDDLNGGYLLQIGPDGIHVIAMNSANIITKARMHLAASHQISSRCCGSAVALQHPFGQLPPDQHITSGHPTIFEDIGD